MFLLASIRRLGRLGILGINRRNAECILDRNPRRLFPVVDDKLRLHRLCAAIGVPTPAIHAVIGRQAELRSLADRLRDFTDFVVKPNRGSAGRGVLVIGGRTAEVFRRHNGEPVSPRFLEAT